MKFKIFNLSNVFILVAIFAAWWTMAELIRPVLHYHFQQIAFVTGLEFFNNYKIYPGGIADYTAEFIAQFFNYNSLGSFLIVLVASLQGFIALYIYKRLRGEIMLGLAVFSILLFFGIIVFTSYYYPYYASIRLLFAFMFSLGYCILHQRFQRLSPMIWFFLALLLFYLAGGPALFVFTASAISMLTISFKKRIELAWIPAFLLFAGALPYLSYEFFCQMSLNNHYNIILFKPPAMLTYTPEISIYIYYLFLPLVLAGLVLINMFPVGKTKTKATGKVIKSKINFYKREVFIISVQAIACFGLCYFLFVQFYDPVKKNLLQVDYYAEHEQWSELLKTTKSLNQYDFLVNFQGSRALSHLGELPERLFEYPQLGGTYGLFIEAAMAKSSALPTSDLFFDLGYMAESQQWAFEAQTLLPNSPRVLKRLIMINIINRKYDLAKKYLEILDHNMLYRDWVKKYNLYVADTIQTNNDKLIFEKRHQSPQITYINTSNEGSLRLLVETDPDNRMAYDYLMSYYLLDLNLANFVEYLKRYNNYKITKLPRSWEEGLVFYIAKSRSYPEFLPQNLLSKKCIDRFTDFTNKVKPYKNNMQAAKDIVYNSYGESYWYYLLYLSPKVTKVLENKIPVK